ncbi:EamA family transporter [Brevibacillus migulae]|uniref:EamA family transporter n=1 Tax=Brevibacillus migulae TaxID=1644114 RepID=UPI001F459DFB|nr:DMT family transporter [Brevibacillus migulae]
MEQLSMVNKSDLSRLKGLAMAFFGAALWGISGAAAQVLFQDIGVPPGWLVTIRLLCAGGLLLAIGLCGPHRQEVGKIWTKPGNRMQLIIFAIFGMLGVQYTYFAAIEAGNAATATLLQFLGPVFITVYLALRSMKLPTVQEFSALALACTGMFLLVTNGSLKELSISTSAVLWGLGSAVTAAFYTLYPKQLLNNWNSLVVVGWSMLLGGLGLSIINPPWQIGLELLTVQSLSLIGFVILFGTLIPFYLYIESLRYISPAEAGLLNSAEPLCAVVVSVVWLQVSFGLFEAIGALCIIATVALLTTRPGKRKTASASKD